MVTTVPRLDIEFTEDQLPGADLHRVLAEARSMGPVVEARLLGAPAYLITRFADLKAFFADGQQFPGGPVYCLQTKPVIGDTFINMDEPDHTRYRQLVTPSLRSRAAARFVDRDLVPLAHEIIDRFAHRGQADLVAEFSNVLPFWSISRKLGLPVGTEERQRELAHALLSYPVSPDHALAAAQEVTDFLDPIVEDRRRNPGDDVLSELLRAQHDGLQLSDDDIYSHIRLLYSVGATTTSDSMSSLLWAVLTHPEVHQRALTDPAFHPAVVGELLRWESPVATLPRTAPKGGTVAGFDIPEGAFVLAGITSANHDPAVHTDPDRFDPGREPAEIMTFGFGAKFCPGSHMARHQLAAALTAVLDRLPNLRVREAEPPTGAILRSVKTLDVAWNN